ncbi:roadblock/LC7 domain-containing protein [Deinococcus sp. KSM4-11]|uniref:roadblock/LC7 domain-containing protein n=1 Tax=Deinococcus sp. KSM4-11 TaxID=2568654 RepID=UPI0010A4B5FB|nr:roadblock/LC7 domain-containing protein [Deinococcus sp. KSM4-11]THF85217.1 roadblock/LC7 domain-containing protein [Deinococcus sp. KSM4-11]
MTNAVYTMIVRALGKLVSDRAAESMLRTALRDLRLSPDTVTGSDMQRVLSGPLLARLSTVLPQGRARQELLGLSRQLEATDVKAPTLFTQPGPSASWEEHSDATATSWDQLDLDVDDFEFDDPDSALTSTGQSYDLDSPLGQEDLLQALGRLSGVQGVMVCRANGEVLRVRAIREAPGLGAVVAASALLFQQRTLRLLSAELGGRTVCVRPLGAYCVAVIVNSQSNVGRLLVELQQLKAAA